MKKLTDHTIHKYKRVTLSSRREVVYINGERCLKKVPDKQVFKCAIPGCPTWKLRELVIDNKSICWQCGEELILNMENTTLKHPTHKHCRKTREVA